MGTRGLGGGCFKGDQIDKFLHGWRGDI